MNALQKKELELLTYFIDVCQKLGLEYYLVCGSALGAVKYGGFIPWDDDLDVALPRPDYERFVKEAQKLLPPHIFLQNSRTDPAFPQIFSKLRDSNTTYLEKSVAKLPMNHGIYIDVFPLDGYPPKKRDRILLEFRKRMYQHQLNTVVDVPRNLKSQLHFLFYRLLGCHKRTAEIAQRYDRMIASHTVADSAYWCNHGNWQGRLEYAPAEQYGRGIEAEFEGIKVRIPKEYDAYLTQKYGDWRGDLPKEEQVGHHYYEICVIGQSGFWDGST